MGEAVASPWGHPTPTKTASKCGPRHMGAEATKLEHRRRGSPGAGPGHWPRSGDAVTIARECRPGIRSPVVGGAALRAWAPGSWHCGRGEPFHAGAGWRREAVDPSLVCLGEDGVEALDPGHGWGRPLHRHGVTPRPPRLQVSAGPGIWGQKPQNWNTAGEDHRVLDPDTGPDPVTLSRLLESAGQA
ncbi:hypothetical protein NDU88_000094 [Pleurodeles waltl]|uniref:Uncharacterized protein n=1 Tax=Pleurodeles waltl TaxID=8319 RepID=A0AAV7UP17_PLEWA|nr:hypothetical protein NDU88_000094 [Pleurodeles waltl]